MAKITLTDLANLQNETTAVSAINTNNASIASAMENTLSRDGTLPNHMGASLDMNSNPILNLPKPTQLLSPLRLEDLDNFDSTGVMFGAPDVFDSVALASAATISVSSSTVYTTGYFAAGDKGRAQYTRAVGSTTGGFQSADGAWWELAGPTFNVYQFGAKGDGVSNDTTAIEDFFDYCSANNVRGYVLSGSFVYNGSGHSWPTSTIYLLGEGAESSIFIITSSAYLIDTAVAKTDVHISGIKFSGGLGAFRSTFAGTNVSNHKTFENNVFKDYTECAIQANGDDEPYWKIMNNVFSGVNSTNTIGVALPRNANNSTISDNSFLLNRIQIKLRRAGPTVIVGDNDFIQFDVGNVATPRMSIWFVPGEDFIDGGNGCVVRGNKYGNENLQTFDYANVIADEGAGTFNGDMMPVLNVDSVGSFQSHLFIGNHIAGAGINGTRPFIFSTTPYFFDNQIVDNLIYGTRPTAWLEFLSTPAFFRVSQNVFGPNMLGDAGSEGIAFPLVLGGTGFGFSPDPGAMFETRPENPHSYTGGGQDYAGYIELYNSATTPLVANGTGVNLGAVTDASGGTDAFEFSLDPTGNVTGDIPNGSVTVGVPSWIEVDLKQGAVDPLTVLRVTLANIATDDQHFKRYLFIANTWNRYRFPFIFREQTTDIAMVFDTNLEYNATTPSGQVEIGRVRIYHARDPISFGRSTFEHINLALLPTSAAGLNPGTAWVDTGAGNVVKMV